MLAPAGPNPSPNRYVQLASFGQLINCPHIEYCIQTLNSLDSIGKLVLIEGNLSSDMDLIVFGMSYSLMQHWNNFVARLYTMVEVVGISYWSL